MKRLLLTTAALLLAACDTVPYGEPGPPAYPGDAYPPSPYPPDTGYPAQTPYPPGPPPGPQFSCPITTSRDWTAWVSAMPGPGARPKLIVTGKVVTPTGSGQISFDPYLQVTKRYPAQAFATLRVAAPTGASQGVETHDVRWEWPLNQQIGSVEIRCGDQTLASISPVGTAH